MAHRALIPQTSPPPGSADVAWGIIHRRSTVGSSNLSVPVFVVVIVFSALAALLLVALWLPPVRGMYKQAIQGRRNAEFERQVHLRGSPTLASLTEKGSPLPPAPDAACLPRLVDIPDLNLPPAMMYETPEHNHSQPRFEEYER